MSGTGGGTASGQSVGADGSASSHPPAPPKILLAKPGLVTAGKFIRGGSIAGDESASLRSRLPSVGSVNLLSDSWEFQTDRFLPFLTDNTDFVVIGIIGPTGVGKSTIMNELYGFDGTSPGMLPPFAVQTEETRAMAKHCSVGIEPRISAERIILLDTQPLFSPSVLAEIIRPDGSSTVSVLSGEPLSAELAHELMGIQISTLGSEKEVKDKIQEGVEEYMAAPVFVHTKLRDQDLTPRNFVHLRKALTQYFSSSSFPAAKCQNAGKDDHFSCASLDEQTIDSDSKLQNLFVLPFKSKDESPRAQYESYISMLWKLRDQVLSMSGPSFGRTVSEREWLKNSAKIWELVKSSPVIAEYSKMLQDSGMFRR